MKEEFRWPFIVIVIVIIFAIYKYRDHVVLIIVETHEQLSPSIACSFGSKLWFIGKFFSFFFFWPILFFGLSLGCYYCVFKS
jgi:hypothetical protein